MARNRVKVGDVVRFEGMVVDRWNRGRSDEKAGDYHIVKNAHGDYFLARTPLYTGFPIGLRVSVEGTALVPFLVDFAENGLEKTAQVLQLNSRSRIQRA